MHTQAQHSGVHTRGHSLPSIINNCCYAFLKYLSNEIKHCSGFRGYLGIYFSKEVGKVPYRVLQIYFMIANDYDGCSPSRNCSGGESIVLGVGGGPIRNFLCQHSIRLGWQELTSFTYWLFSFSVGKARLNGRQRQKSGRIGHFSQL